MSTDDRCAFCEKEFTSRSRFGGDRMQAWGLYFCYDCCSLMDQWEMAINGKRTLYLHTPKDFIGGGKACYVGNWPGTLRYPAAVYRNKYGHNWGLPRYDVYFKDNIGRYWWGVKIGDNHDLVHCRVLKHTPDEYTRLAIARSKTEIERKDSEKSS